MLLTKQVVWSHKRDYSYCMKKKLKKVKNVLTISLSKNEIHNLYHPTSRLGIECFDEVRVTKGFFRKYAAILLKEWFFLVKPQGALTIEYREDDGITFDFVEQQLWWLLRGNYTITSHVVKEKKGSVSIRKNHSQLVAGDSIEKWTFGIITNGERDDWMEEILESIRALKIPHYEIIVCGKYKERKEDDFIYIPFNERAERGWITKKKNLICEKAAFENLCIIHDRLVFDKDWFKGMKQYGNVFEMLGCVQTDRETGVQAGDWLTHGGPLRARYKIARLNYEDWDYNIYLSGQLTIMKKSIWKKVLWDETRYWGEEDVDFSFRARDFGFIIRFNPFSKVHSITWRHGKLPLKYDSSQGLLPKDMMMRRIMRFPMQIAHRYPILNAPILFAFKYISKTSVYKYFVYH